jgi:hypothetical protein
VDSNDVSESVDDWEVLEFAGIDDDGGELSLLVESWVNNLERADESLRVDFVWESGVNDNTIEVAWLTGSEGSFAELNILVLKQKTMRLKEVTLLTLVCCLAGDLDLLGVDFLADLAIWYFDCLKI